MYQKDEDKYQIEATYQPRRHKLIINRFDNAPEEPLDIGKKLINNLFGDLFEPKKSKIPEMNSIEKVLKHLIEENVPQKRVGSEGEPERYGNPELLGSEGEPEMYGTPKEEE